MSVFNSPIQELNSFVRYQIWNQRYKRKMATKSKITSPNYKVVPPWSRPHSPSTSNTTNTPRPHTNQAIFLSVITAYVPVATAPPANYSRSPEAYAGAYEMRNKVWQEAETTGAGTVPRVSPPPDYPGTPVAEGPQRLDAIVSLASTVMGQQQQSGTAVSPITVEDNPSCVEGTR